MMVKGPWVTISYLVAEEIVHCKGREGPEYNCQNCQDCQKSPGLMCGRGQCLAIPAFLAIDPSLKAKSSVSVVQEGAYNCLRISAAFALFMCGSGVAEWRRMAISSATIATAISSGVIAPMSIPTGAYTRASFSAETPSFSSS